MKLEDGACVLLRGKREDTVSPRWVVEMRGTESARRYRQRPGKSSVKFGNGDCVRYAKEREYRESTRSW